MTATATASVSTVGVASVTITAGGAGYVDGMPVPLVLYATIVSPIATYGPFALPYNAGLTSIRGACVWQLSTTVDFPGSALAAPVANVPIILTFYGDTGGLTVNVGGGAGGSFTCVGGNCTAPIVNGCIPGTAAVNTAYGLTFLMGICTSRPYSSTVGTYTFSLSAASAGPIFSLYVFLGGTCGPPTTTVLSITVSE